MDIGTGISLAGGVIGLIFAAEMFFGRNARTEVSASQGERAANDATTRAVELDKQTSLLKAEFTSLANQLREQNEALKVRDKELGERTHANAGKIQEHDGRLHTVEASFGRLEKVAVEALTQMAQANSQGAAAIAAVAKALDRLNESVDVSQRIARLEGLMSSHLEPPAPNRRPRRPAER